MADHLSAGHRRTPAIRQWDREYGPKDPIGVVADLKAPVLGLYGGADPGIPVASVERMREALKAAGKTAEIIVYPETPHAFHSDYRPSYREGPAKDGWPAHARVVQALRRRLNRLI